MASNPFKEAEERKKKEAQERAKKAAEEAAKAGIEAGHSAVSTQPEAVQASVREAPAAPAVRTVPPANAYESAVNALREQIDAERGSMEKKVPVNIMIKPSLKRKMEQDVRNKKFKSMSFLITSLLEEYYK